MNAAKWTALLTFATRDRHIAPMMVTGGRMRRMAQIGAAGAVLCGLSACINVNAPAEPIVIELNVNIKQEVLYRLVDSAEENISENPEIF
ncbi:YnbE family lipoprotein [Croceicoccus naphthovorans]|uniref:Uncharacterized protein n=1 Tax=Croceicoccus naphthovorans TaxID=1348774 RepID=A0A0G3XGB6_9SPHN|nr:YnbE family lipoprotein [Croceicoccus naphthovorans]AKM09676.1 hypothetical protein AB433_06275 [Croceicoccus naphthovorans]MBB3990803.1 hypothetical protein [Croceicoccus naphthovorans]